MSEYENAAAYEAFLLQRKEICQGRDPAIGVQLKSATETFQEALDAMPELANAAIKRSTDPEHQLRGYCSPAAGVTPDELERALERIWLQALRFDPGEDAYIVSRGADSIILDCVTVPELSEYYVAARIRVEDVQFYDPDANSEEEADLRALFGTDAASPDTE